MSNGNEIYNVFKYINDFYEQTAILLQCSDKILAKCNWECLHSNNCYKDSSTSIHGYNKWSPQYLYRFYMKNDSNDLIYIAITMNDVENKYKDFNEPIISACYIKNKEGVSVETVKNAYKHWWANFYPWSYSDKNGTIHAELSVDWGEDADEYPTIESIKVFGYRLVDIQKEIDLEEIIISKLLNLIEK